MATAYQNLSSTASSNSIPSALDMKFAIVVAEWNQDITFALRDGAVNTLLANGALKENIIVDYVPGTFELTYAANLFINQSKVDSVIVLGTVVRGDTPHFDYVCQGVTFGIAKLNSESNIPVIFGVLTTDDMQQAIDRAGGIHGNKGDEAAITAIKMVDLTSRITRH
ncbi:MAG: 6,7-dimethyl-8-ribityllumazine synthase [Bacteroidales bacterium]